MVEKSRDQIVVDRDMCDLDAEIVDLVKDSSAVRRPTPRHAIIRKMKIKITKAKEVAWVYVILMMAERTQEAKVIEIIKIIKMDAR